MVPQVISVHGSLFIAVLLYLLACAVWGFGLAVRRLPISPSYRGALRLAELLLVAQSVVGAMLFLSGRRPHDQLHLIYGFVILLVLPAAEGFGQQWWRGRRQSLVVALACLFAMGLAIRAAMTGPP